MNLAVGCRVRFAPSPTGPLHLGGARVALFNWLFARRVGGKFILRIEDTDAARSTLEYEAKIMESLRRLGLEWDEGPDIGGPCGPYRQVERHAEYKKAAGGLAAKGITYPCYCSGEELEIERKRMMSRRQAPRYSGKCRALSEEERERKDAEGIRPSTRFIMPEGQTIHVNDEVRGDVAFETSDLGDFIIVRSDGSASFLLASAVDDVLMGITHVIRGEDHLSNTPRQIMIIRAMGNTPPHYAHLPMVLDEEGKKLSKRAGATDILELLGSGHAPEAINTAMAMLGWAGVDGSEPETLESMAKRFDIGAVSRSPARYDLARLESLGARALRKMSTMAFLETIGPLARNAGLDLERGHGQDMDAMAEAVRGGMSGPADAVAQLTQFITMLAPDEMADATLREPESARVTLALIMELSGLEKLDKDSFKTMIESISLKTGVKGKKLYMAARAAATGRTSGPKLADLYCILGPQAIAARLEKTANDYGMK
ncbi:MAG: glutamate--tRNA ligase [Nitrospinota bacterium]|nr:glutamate--tRNA ligase [Nitrospinota bacterium]